MFFSVVFLCDRLSSVYIAQKNYIHLSVFTYTNMVDRSYWARTSLWSIQSVESPDRVSSKPSRAKSGTGDMRCSWTASMKTLCHTSEKRCWPQCSQKKRNTEPAQKPSSNILLSAPVISGKFTLKSFYGSLPLVPQKAKALSLLWALFLYFFLHSPYLMYKEMLLG